jgi:hypothetical protein
MKLRLALLAVLALFFGSLPAVAQTDLYDDGPTDGTTDAWTINFGFAVSDQFTLSSSSQVNGLQFAAWLFPGDVLESVEISITSSEYGGTTYFDQQVNLTQSGCALNQLSFDVCNETASFTPISMNAGSYWLNMQNGVVNTGDPVYWDENRGPSWASEGSLGSIPSESFTILGASNSTTTTGTTPEPGSLMLFGSSALGLLGILRHRYSR